MNILEDVTLHQVVYIFIVSADYFNHSFDLRCAIFTVVRVAFGIILVVIPVKSKVAAHSEHENRIPICFCFIRICEDFVPECLDVF